MLYFVSCMMLSAFLAVVIGATDKGIYLPLGGYFGSSSPPRIAIKNNSISSLPQGHHMSYKFAPRPTTNMKKKHQNRMHFDICEKGFFTTTPAPHAWILIGATRHQNCLKQTPGKLLRKTIYFWSKVIYVRALNLGPRSPSQMRKNLGLKPKVCTKHAK